MPEVSGEQSLPVHLAHIVLSADRQGKRSPRGDFVPALEPTGEREMVPCQEHLCTRPISSISRTLQASRVRLGIEAPDPGSP